MTPAMLSPFGGDQSTTGRAPLSRRAKLNSPALKAWKPSKRDDSGGGSGMD